MNNSTIDPEGATNEPVLPTIQINRRDLPDVRNDIVLALLAINNPPTVFVRDGRLCKVEVLRNGIAEIRQLSVEKFRTLASNAAYFVKADKNDETTPAFLSLEICRDILFGGEPSLAFPRLNDITECPMVSADGKIEDVPGYLAGTEMYFAPIEGDDFKVEHIQPTDENVRRAKDELFGYLLDGFEFADKAASKANALAFALQPVVRQLIDGPTPLYVVDAPVRGSGKSLLVETLGGITSPARLSPKSPPREDAEWRKIITSTLRKGNQHVWFDNLKGQVTSSALCIALTSTSWSDRLLGQNEDLILPNFPTWVATGNNVNLDEEVASRTVGIRLDTKTEQPELRTGFKCPNPRLEVRKHRAHYLGLLLCLVQHWIDKGMPLYSGTAASRYPAWLSVMGGLLESVGVCGLIENYEHRTKTSSPEHMAWSAFVSKWGLAHGSTAVTVLDDLVPHAFGTLDPNGRVDKPGPLLDQLRCQPTSRSTKLGKALDERADRVYGDWRITKGPLHDGIPTYQLEAV